MLELAAKGGARRPRLRADNVAHRHSFDGEARATALQPKLHPELQPRASSQHTKPGRSRPAAPRAPKHHP